MPQSTSHTNCTSPWKCEQHIVVSFNTNTRFIIYLHSVFSIFIQSLETMLLLLLPLALHFHQQRFYFYKRYSRVFIHDTRVLVFIDFFSLSLSFCLFYSISMINRWCIVVNFTHRQFLDSFWSLFCKRNI